MLDPVMRICSDCGKANQDHYKFCLGCGRDLSRGDAPAVALSAPVASVNASPTVDGASSVTVRINVKCAHCAGAIPVNGPAQRVRCGACLRETALPDLAEALQQASRGTHALGSRYDIVVLSDPTPQCVRCGASLSIQGWLGKPGIVPCGHCAAGVPSYAAPAWLLAALPGVQWIFGGAPAAQPGGGVAVEIPERAVAPVAMACPQCNAGLRITAEDGRTVGCRFCGTDVFLPDELWRHLHPVATMRTWTLVGAGAGLRGS